MEQILWTVNLVRQAKRAFKELPKGTSQTLGLLLEDLEKNGYQRYNWPNFSKLKDAIYHCLLEKGRPTYVACWRVFKNDKLIEVYMLGQTRKHRTEEGSFDEKSSERSRDSINWRIASKEAFGDISRAALNLRGLRNREGLTQEQFGQAIGVEQSNVSKMERGVRQIGLKIAKQIGEIFNIDYHLFL